MSTILNRRRKHFKLKCLTCQKFLADKAQKMKKFDNPQCFHFVLLRPYKNIVQDRNFFVSSYCRCMVAYLLCYHCGDKIGIYKVQPCKNCCDTGFAIFLWYIEANKVISYQ